MREVRGKGKTGEKEVRARKDYGECFDPMIM